MPILVTGDAGYLGSAFVKAHAGNYEITGYDLASGDDLLNYPALLAKASDCEMVVHLAAIPKPVEGAPIHDYFAVNVTGTLNALRAAHESGAKRFVYASSTTIYGIEQGIPFRTPIDETQPFVSQYLKADDLQCREEDLSYHVSKVQAEQLVAWYGLNRKMETVALRFGPIGGVLFGTGVQLSQAVNAIHLALGSERRFWYEPITIVDDAIHIDTSRATELLGFVPGTTDGLTFYG